MINYNNKFMLNSISNGLNSLHTITDKLTIDEDIKSEMFRIISMLSLNLGQLTLQSDETPKPEINLNEFYYSKTKDGFFAYHHKDDMYRKKHICPVCFDIKRQVIHLQKMDIRKLYRCPKCRTDFSCKKQDINE